MAQLGESLEQLWFALLGVFVALFEWIEPWWPLVLGLGLWIAFWLLAVNWFRLRDVLFSGGWIGVVLIGLIWILVWGVVAPPEDGRHYLFGLSVSNFVGKTVYVTVLYCIAALCGSVQLSGALGSCCGHSAQEEPEPVHVPTHAAGHH